LKEIKKHLIIQCKLCKDIIKSNYRHDFKYCKCGAIFIDGGYDYTRLGGNLENIKELHLEDQNGEQYPLPKPKEEKKKQIKISSAKAKGRNLQKWVCDKISKLIKLSYGYEDDKLISPRIMGQGGVDVVLRGEALKKFPYSVECKNQESWSIPAYIRQAKKNKLPNTDWLLILKKKEFQKPVVILEAEKFFEILERIK
jgi:hypothetical protein